MIRTEGLTKVFRRGKHSVTALAGVGLEIGEGEFVLIKGPSGSGKSTLLFLLGGLLLPTAGKVWISGHDLFQMNDRERSRFRGEHIGFVFQSYHLLPYLSVKENILLANKAVARKDGREELRILLQRLGLEEREDHLPGALSAGEKQRVALARALLRHPKLILADEPTGNLDPAHAGVVIRLLHTYQQEGGTVVMVSHDDHADRVAERTILMEKGRIVQ